jgi:hypothetical protein
MTGLRKGKGTMFKNPANNAIWSIIVGSLAGLLTITIFPYDFKNVITVLNGLYVGSMFGIIFAYWRLIIATIVGHPPFDRARQYALSVFILWGALNCFIFGSVWSKSAGVDTHVYFYSIVGRYGGILAAWLQVTAPGFGEGFFHGRDRKVLWIAVAISTAVSAFLIFAQSQTILS